MDALLNLKRNKGATQTKKRLGRGKGSGLGSKSGRGGRGQTARTGGNIKPGFTGGQTKLQMQQPKFRGFKNINRIVYQPVNIQDLNKFEDGAEINAKSLLAKNLIAKENQPVKILGTGELTKKLKITVNKVSATAKAKIEQSKSTLTELDNKSSI